MISSNEVMLLKILERVCVTVGLLERLSEENDPSSSMYWKGIATHELWSDRLFYLNLGLSVRYGHVSKSGYGYLQSFSKFFHVLVILPYLSENVLNSST